MVNDDEYFDEEEIQDDEPVTKVDIFADEDELTIKMIELNANINAQIEFMTTIMKHLNIELPDEYEDVDEYVAHTRQIFYEIEVEEFAQSRGYNISTDSDNDALDETEKNDEE